jgi:hypothetical protein
MIIGYKHLACLVWFILHVPSRLLHQLKPFVFYFAYFLLSCEVILEKLICKSWIIQSVSPFAAKRLARAIPPKRSGMNLNNETQDRRRKIFCCSV